MATCEVCFRHCEIPEGKTGFCGARTAKDGIVTASNYGKITAIALDPIEKKPLNRFFLGSRILSVGSYGCNLSCPFCQNHDISRASEKSLAREIEILTPEELARLAKAYEDHGNIGLAFTYNEPLIGYEFVRDTAKLVHEAGMKNVLVTNGTAELSVLEELLPCIDAMNIDLKGFTDKYYREILGGDFEMVKAFIRKAVQSCHVEITTLIVPGWNDTEEEMRELTAWIASLTDREGNRIGESVPLHISRFFPRYHVTDRKATDVKLVYRLKDVACDYLRYVYTGNC